MTTPAQQITLASLDTVAGQQSALNYVGFGPLDVDGITGPKTKAATKSFQSSRGLVVDGIWGPATKGAMFAAVQATEGVDPVAALIQNGLSQAAAVLIGNNQENAPAAPAASILPTLADVQAVHASLQVSGGGSASLAPIPSNSLPAKTPPAGIMGQAKDFYAAHPTATVVGGGAVALGVGYLAFRAMGR